MQKPERCFPGEDSKADLHKPARCFGFAMQGSRITPIIFSTSTRASFKFTPMLFRTLAAIPVDSPIKPSNICSVPTKLWPSRRASSWASMTTLMACKHIFGLSAGSRCREKLHVQGATYIPTTRADSQKVTGLSNLCGSSSTRTTVL